MSPFQPKTTCLPSGDSEGLLTKRMFSCACPLAKAKPANTAIEQKKGEMRTVRLLGAVANRHGDDAGKPKVRLIREVPAELLFFRSLGALARPVGAFLGKESCRRPTKTKKRAQNLKEIRLYCPGLACGCTFFRRIFGFFAGQGR
jgi:hypothetical protein